MFQYQKEFLTKRVSGEIAFDLIRLFHVKLQEPTRSSTSTTAFVWPLYNWRYKDLSMSHDQKVMMLLAPMEKCPINFYHDVAFTAQI